MLTFDEARRIVLGLAKPTGHERVALDDADGRVLAVDVVAGVDSPETDTSAMDGYAVLASEIVAGEPVAVRGEATPGTAPAHLAPKTAMRIFTGGPVPRGADAIVPQEDTERSGAGVVVRGVVKTGAHVRRRGEDLPKGAVALSSGTRLSPAKVGLLASLDHAWVTTFRRPAVTIVATGDELRAPGTLPFPGSIAESGSVMVRAMSQRAGALARVAPRVHDDLDAVTAALDAALRGSDLVVTIGGMSVGDHDLVRPALERLGVTLALHKVAIKPGKPLGLGHRGDALVLGLPGNPAAASVTFALFGVPLLRALAGDSHPITPPLRGTLGAPLRRKAGRLEFVRATLAAPAGLLVATPLAHQSSGSVASVGQADALVVVPAEATELDAGAAVDVLPFSALGA